MDRSHTPGSVLGSFVLGVDGVLPEECSLPITPNELTAYIDNAPSFVLATPWENDDETYAHYILEYNYDEQVSDEAEDYYVYSVGRLLVLQYSGTTIRYTQAKTFSEEVDDEGRPIDVQTREEEDDIITRVEDGYIPDLVTAKRVYDTRISCANIEADYSARVVLAILDEEYARLIEGRENDMDMWLPVLKLFYFITPTILSLDSTLTNRDTQSLTQRWRGLNGEFLALFASGTSPQGDITMLGEYVERITDLYTMTRQLLQRV